MPFEATKRIHHDGDVGEPAAELHQAAAQLPLSDSAAGQVEQRPHAAHLAEVKAGDATLFVVRLNQTGGDPVGQPFARRAGRPHEVDNRVMAGRRPVLRDTADAAQQRILTNDLNILAAALQPAGRLQFAREAALYSERPALLSQNQQRRRAADVHRDAAPVLSDQPLDLRARQRREAASQRDVLAGQRPRCRRGGDR